MPHTHTLECPLHSVQSAVRLDIGAREPTLCCLCVLQVWTRAFEAKAADLQTLVLGIGSEWWRQHDYPSSPDGCHTPAGMADAFTPLSSMGLLDHQAYYRTCDVVSEPERGETEEGRSIEEARGRGQIER